MRHVRPRRPRPNFIFCSGWVVVRTLEYDEEDFTAEPRSSAEGRRQRKDDDGLRRQSYEDSITKTTKWASRKGAMTQRDEEAKDEEAKDEEAKDEEAKDEEVLAQCRYEQVPLKASDTDSQSPARLGVGAAARN